MGREESLEELETDSLGEHSYGWRQTAAGGGTLPPSGDGRRDTSLGGCSTVSLLPPSRRLRAGPGGTGRRVRLALPAPRAAAAGRGSPASRGGAAAARQAASLWESERGAGSAGEARG